MKVQIGAFSISNMYNTAMYELESSTDIAGPAQPGSASQVITDLGWPELQLLGRTN